MAMKVEQVILGADVSKDWLDIHRYGKETAERIDNEPTAIDAFLTRHPAAVLAVEATNTYHEDLVERAQRAGWRVYLLSGYQLKHYAVSIGQRMRTDPIDARLIARYLAHEIDQLTPYQPKSPEVRRLWQLLKRRALLAQSRQQLQQSLAGLAELQSAQQQLYQSYRHIIADIDRRLRQLTQKLGWQHELTRLTTLPGVGPLTAMALLVAYRTGTFIHHDPYIAYLGLDVRTKDSGKHKGQRKLTKHGDGEYRRLLFCAAMAAKRSNPHFTERYQQLLARGLSTTAALVVIARKLARLAFHLLRLQCDFNPARLAPSTRPA
jgi:transposase